MARKKAVSRTDADRLRTLVTASYAGEHRYTQKELASMLGVSVRTLRRAKNIDGYVERMAPRTFERIRAPLHREESKLRRFVIRKYGVPDTPVLQFPKETDLRSGARSLVFDVSEWETNEKTYLLLGYKSEGGYHHWNLRVKLPKGMVYVPASRQEAGYIVADAEVENPGESEIYSTNPELFSLRAGRIEQIVRYHDDAGRRVIGIYVFQSKRNRKKKRKGEK